MIDSTPWSGPGNAGVLSGSTLAAMNPVTAAAKKSKMI
jgi:hypothetical protein